MAIYNLKQNEGITPFLSLEMLKFKATGKQRTTYRKCRYKQSAFNTQPQLENTRTPRCFQRKSSFFCMYVHSIG